MGEAVDESLSQMAPEDVRAVVTYVRSVPPVVAPDLPAIRPSPADASHRSGPASADAQGKQVFEGACASCHSWSGVSALSPLATLTGARAVNDPSARNIAQVVIGGASRTTPHGGISMPAFGSVYSDAEIAAVANYVSGRFGSRGASLSAQDVAEFRRQVSQ
jgi:mono/diheme cytochrome c family protein